MIGFMRVLQQSLGNVTGCLSAQDKLLLPLR
jgi:hypothetical protein